MSSTLLSLTRIFFYLHHLEINQEFIFNIANVLPSTGEKKLVCTIYF